MSAEKLKVLRVYVTELPEDKRVGRLGPVLYAQNPVTPSTEEAAILLRMLEKVARLPNGLTVEGAYIRLQRNACGHKWACSLGILSSQALTSSGLFL